MALLFYLVRTRFSRPPLRSKALTGGSLVLIYLTSLVTHVMVPYLLSEVLCRLLHVRPEYSSMVLLLPHLYMVLIRKEILEFIQQTLSGKK
ncbi:hypothetical protein [Hymenobacter elongatus]|uniref:Uncharacterized protein n=1 Tax=Hymenobacter elongatus TaxID=877208 RepID=A0A4Z0PPT7_9BACT|nr:hypothetical protein [Hymenobacter elongatus]TGE18300.1 hypothetical protein E5J99_05185 [Hymenobacter elongatus]